MLNKRPNLKRIPNRHVREIEMTLLLYYYYNNCLKLCSRLRIGLRVVRLFQQLLENISISLITGKIFSYLNFAQSNKKVSIYLKIIYLPLKIYNYQLKLFEDRKKLNAVTFTGKTIITK